MRPENPYCLFSSMLAEAICRQPVYCVRQYYHRGLDPARPQLIPLLISHYTHHDIDRERASRHFGFLKKDKYRAFYDSTREGDRERLAKAALQPPGFLVYINILPKPWMPSARLRLKAISYFAERTGNNYLQEAPVRIRLQDLYGKLYLFLKGKSTSIEVLMEEIEKRERYVL